MTGQVKPADRVRIQASEFASAISRLWYIDDERQPLVGHNIDDHSSLMLHRTAPLHTCAAQAPRQNHASIIICSRRPKLHRYTTGCHAHRNVRGCSAN
jgi:hypothetical protein